MLLKEITIRRADPDRESGIISYGCNWVAEWYCYEVYFSDKPTKHQARQKLLERYA